MNAIVSVIVPVYNTAQYLARCIDSILCQSFTDFELLLVDDGSTDGSGAICDAYAEKESRIRVFHKENGGASSARNLGLDNARGEWITFVDSDDFVEKDYFPTVLDKTIDLLALNMRFANGEVREWYESNEFFQADYCQFMAENIQAHTFRTVCSLVFKRQILENENIRFDTKFKLGEDTLFVMNYYQFAKSLQIMGDSCYVYDRQEAWENKYCLTWREANDYLDAFMDRYDALPFESMALLGFMFNFVYSKIKKEELPNSWKWALAKPVLRYKEKMLPIKEEMYRAKYHLSKALSFFANV